PKVRIDPASIPSYVAGIFEDLDPTPTLELALRLHPDTRRLVAIRGAYEAERSWDKLVRDAVERLDGNLEVEYLAGLPTAHVLKRVAALPGGTIVFTGGYRVDGAGKVFPSTVQSIGLIAQASAVPVYGAYDSQVGTGIVGGYMHRFEDEGKEAAAMIVKL